MIDITVPAWMDEARCSGAPSDIFFPESGGNSAVAYARNICAGCDVQTACLSYAIADPTIEGIWAGTTEIQRKALRKKAAA